MHSAARWPQPSGRIINLSTGAATLAVPHLGAYAVAKTALTRFTENLAAELVNSGVCVFAISPGTVRTALTEYILESEAGKKWLPWFRILYERGLDVPAEKVAQLVVQLASGRADALSGRLIDVVDDLAKLQERLEEVKRDNLYMLRVPKLDSENRKQKLAIGGG
jgi:NAD(P)-dependent dehydrogenase (short-subunit alcohol dehydrogenase family)